MSIRSFITQGADPSAPGYVPHLCPGGAQYAVGVVHNLRVTKGQSVYLMSTPDGHWKIGIAKDPEQRRRALQCGCPVPITFEGGTVERDDGADPILMERVAHQILEPWRSQGEWFRAPDEVIYRAWKEAWCAVRYPPLYRRWQRFCLYIRAMRGKTP